jgi:hypothetical protein
MRVKKLPAVKVTIGDRNIFLPDENIIYIDPTLYGADGYNKKIFFGIDPSGALVEKKLTLCDALFHELCHTFHKYSEKDKETSAYLDAIYSGRHEKYLWTDKKIERQFEDDEEMYNITGYYLDSGKYLAPISCNMFNICKYSSNSKSIIQRVFHIYWRDIKTYKTAYDYLHKINEFLIDLNQYVLTKS